MNTDPSADARPPVPCPRCGGQTRDETVKTAIWRDDRLFVVEDIPARVCGTCMEQYYDDDTTEALRRLTEEGFSSIEAKREQVVPIFSLEGRIVRRVAPDEETPADY